MVYNLHTIKDMKKNYTVKDLKDFPTGIQIKKLKEKLWNI